MRIAFILDSFPALSETFILNQITGLLDRGHHVDIYACRPSNEPKVHIDVERYGLADRTYYQTAPPNKFRRLVGGVGLILNHFRMKPEAILESLNIFKYGRDSLALIKLYEVAPFLDKAPYDILHCHYGPNGNLAVWLKEIGAIEGKIVVVFHGYDLSFHLTERGDGVYNDLFAKGDLFLPVNQRWRDKLIRLGCDAQKIVIHRMGIDLEKFTFCSRGPKGNGKVKVITMARLVRKKGLEYAIRAVSKVLRDYSNLEYEIVGDGPLRESLTDLVNELKVSDQIKLVGWKDQHEVAILLQKADILLAPSVTGQKGDEEGIPLALMEGMARGLPVISTHHGGIPELIQDGKSGFLVPEGDINAMAEKLAYLIDHQELWSEMGRVGRRCVEIHHNIDKLIDRQVELCQQLLAKG